MPPTKVLAFGTFDMIHPGHMFFLTSAKKHADRLTVVVARDKTVLTVKHKFPLHKEQERMKNLMAVPEVDEVRLGSLGDKYKIIEDVNPDIICLGYDQNYLTDRLSEELKKRKLKARIVRISSFKPEVFKTSKLI